MKRFLLISYHTCPLASFEGKESGGMNVYVYELAQHLGRLGYYVDVITRRAEEDAERIVQVSENFRVIHLDAGSIGIVDKKELLQYVPQFVDSFDTFMKSENLIFDLIHAHYYLSGLIATEIKKRLPHKIPLIMSYHTLAMMKNLVARSPSEQESEKRLEIETSLITSADAIITPSQSDKQYLQYLYNAQPAKLYEIPPGVNTELFRPMDKAIAKSHIGADTKDKIILFVGRIEPLKGIDVLLYALKILVARLPHIPVKLTIVGGDISQHIHKWSTPLRQLAHLRGWLQLNKHVHFVGQKPQHELPFYYNASDVVVMPSHYESFGMAAAEAMACGVPVVTTNVTGISNLIDERHMSLITTVNNPLLLASQLEHLLTHESVCLHIKKDSIASVRDLDWNVITKKIVEVYNKFL